MADDLPLIASFSGSIIITSSHYSQKSGKHLLLIHETYLRHYPFRETRGVSTFGRQSMAIYLTFSKQVFVVDL